MTRCKQFNLVIVLVIPQSVGLFTAHVSLWNVLLPQYMQKSSSPAEWERISQGFEHTWNFPHCVGAIDGKHIVVQAPPRPGSTFYNYKVPIIGVGTGGALGACAPPTFTCLPRPHNNFARVNNSKLITTSCAPPAFNNFLRLCP